MYIFETFKFEIFFFYFYFFDIFGFPCEAQFRRWSFDLPHKWGWARNGTWGREGARKVQFIPALLHYHPYSEPLTYYMYHLSLC